MVHNSFIRTNRSRSLITVGGNAKVFVRQPHLQNENRKLKEEKLVFPNSEENKTKGENI